MKKMSPIEQSKFIESEFRNYINSTFSLSDPDYNQAFLEEMKGTSLYRGPFISLNLPFATSKSINDLIDEGRISPEFRRFSDIPFDRKLYYHQEKAIDRISKGKNVVISTGTGSGKTESFLYPILNSILKEIKLGNEEIGLRALFLYPMNALVNDQIDRVRKILCNYPKITFGFFTGETEEKTTTSLRNNLSKVNECEIPPNELISREEIRNSPPHLLFTNYSMLEYLLIRPNDLKVLASENMNNWHFVVLDEAHTYQGALGIEIAMLMRRVTGLVKTKPQFILTSATLGDEKKGLKDIIAFAESLTSVKYEDDDIIFAKRIQPNEDHNKYQISPSLYPLLNEKKNNLDELKFIAEQYGKFDNYEKTNAIIFDLLKYDQNLFDFFEIASGQTVQDFQTVFEEMSKYNGFSKENELIDFIKLISFANKDEKTFFDCRYHTFIRALDGAFITLPPYKKLRLSNHKKIDGRPAFEIGVCKFCNNIFIIGKIVNHFLIQNDDIDIYENYGEIEEIKIDYFLIKTQVTGIEIEDGKVEEYVVCSNCGHIHARNDLNASSCICGAEFQVELLRVINDSDDTKNNLTKCPCCDRVSRDSIGVVSGFHLGKDQASAVISQILYKVIGNEKILPPKTKQVSGFFDFSSGFSLPPEKTEKQFKQLLAFSDSRQQASFFADFFAYIHERFLRKRLIWNELEKNGHHSIPLESLAKKIGNFLETNPVFDSENESDDEAWICVLAELLNVDGYYGGEGLGLFLFGLDLDSWEESLPTEWVTKYFGKYNINKNDLINLLKVLFDVFRTAPAINYSQANLNADQREQNFVYRRFINKIVLKKNPRLPNTENATFNSEKSFLPVSNGRSNFAFDYASRVLGASETETLEMLSNLFVLLVEKGIIESVPNGSTPGYQINAKKYRIHSYKEYQWFVCQKCGRVTPYNIKNVCPKPDCDGTLTQCNVDDVFSDNYYRKEFMTKEIEKIIVKEHTAQLSTKKAKEYQKDFKNKKINILSCSTTFEMGVDIGTLETVFLRNVPPNPANYIQRAGRAGRREDSNAFVLTFCGANSHDFTYFVDPSKMISGHISPPKFKVTNEKILLRHFTAAGLGFFFRNHPELYKNVDSLIFGGGMDEFQRYLFSKPDDLGKYIDERLLDQETFSKYSDFQWATKIFDQNGNIWVFEQSIKEKISLFEKGEEEARAKNNYVDAQYFKEQIKMIRTGRIIDNLSRFTVIPKYGFPVDVVELNIINQTGRDTDFDLSRDLSQAISEYAPESEIIVDKKKFTSRYIINPPNNRLTKYYYFECPNCEHMNVGIVPEDLDSCENCKSPRNNPILNHFVIPILGFFTDKKSVESRTRKPKKTLAGEIKYLGKGISNEDLINLNNFIFAESTRNDELLVLNENPFFSCPVCGYTKIEKGSSSTKIICKHKTPQEHDCSSQDLFRLSLGHKFKTDVVKISVSQSLDKRQALSLLYAMLEGISDAFDIERRDINGVINKNNWNSYDLIFFDNVPGGAGHVRRVMTSEGLKMAFESAFNKVNLNCCDENTSCYNCLRNYSNQKIHKYLRRKDARDILKNILTKFEG